MYIARALQVQIARIRVCVKDVTDPSLTVSSCAWTTARGTRSVCSARCVSSLSPWAATPETRNSTANTTTNSKSSFIHLVACVCLLARACVCVHKGNISNFCFNQTCFFTWFLSIGYIINYLYFDIINLIVLAAIRTR